LTVGLDKIILEIEKLDTGDGNFAELTIFFCNARFNARISFPSGKRKLFLRFGMFTTISIDLVSERIGHEAP
jgi:hypothetical protein